MPLAINICDDIYLNAIHVLCQVVYFSSRLLHIPNLNCLVTKFLSGLSPYFFKYQTVSPWPKKHIIKRTFCSYLFIPSGYQLKCSLSKFLLKQFNAHFVSQIQKKNVLELSSFILCQRSIHDVKTHSRNAQTIILTSKHVRN